ncbi:MAG: phage shock protein operon transcriptional activator [Pseudomonadales bacterium]
MSSAPSNAAREPHERLLGESPAMLRVMEEVSQVAPLDKPVLVVGERGTGKELIAARLHFLSNRWEGQYVKMNCAAISETLLETELFGHEAGAFTGASKTHRGRFERADGGTLFLDELANTSPLVQEKLLRVIEYGEFERVGGNRTLRCNVRLVAATNEDLPRLADQGRFRHDLLDRLAFDVITLPPLRLREEDILLLAEHFAINMANELGRELFAGFSQHAREQLQSYRWPGNVRELKNVVERAVYRNPPDQEIRDIVFDPFRSPFRPDDKRTAPPARPVFPEAPPEQPSDAADTAPAEVATGAGEPGATLPLDLKEAVQSYEIALIEAALQQARHNQRKAAELLGLTYHQLRGYLRKYELLKKD